MRGNPARTCARRTVDVVVRALLQERVRRLKASPHGRRDALLEERQRVEDLVRLVKDFCAHNEASVAVQSPRQDRERRTDDLIPDRRLEQRQDALLHLGDELSAVLGRSNELLKRLEDVHHNERLFVVVAVRARRVALARLERLLQQSAVRVGLRGELRVSKNAFDDKPPRRLTRDCESSSANGTTSSENSATIARVVLVSASRSTSDDSLSSSGARRLSVKELESTSRERSVGTHPGGCDRGSAACARGCARTGRVRAGRRQPGSGRANPGP